MEPQKTIRYFVFLLAALLTSLTAGCAAPADIITIPLADSSPPASVERARETVLDFLRTGANECVPPKGVLWQTMTPIAQPPAGFDVYRFKADACTMTISYPQPAEEGTIYHVALNDQTGFCWQATVDSHGQVVDTGKTAGIDPGPNNPAAVFCQGEGYRYEVRTSANDQPCGVCVFADESVCRGWDFFYGECRPGDNPADSG